MQKKMCKGFNWKFHPSNYQKSPEIKTTKLLATKLDATSKISVGIEALRVERTETNLSVCQQEETELVFLIDSCFEICIICPIKAKIFLVSYRDKKR